jgi:diguanylate cyclase (GGDEF)-like protein
VNLGDLAAGLRLEDLQAQAFGPLVDALPDATWVVAAGSLTVVVANRAAERLLGRGDLVGARADELVFLPEDLAFWDEAARGPGAQLSSEATLALADGRSLPVLRTIAPMGPSVSAPTHYLVTLADRSAWREAEDVRERTLAELQATLEATADGILVTDLAGRIRAFNRRFAEVWDLPPDLLQSRADDGVHDWLRRSVVEGEEYQRRLSAIREATLMQATDRLVLHSGQIIERVTRPLWQRGRPMGRVYCFRDLSDRIAADERIERLSHTDALTGLVNRPQLSRAVERATERANQRAAAGSAVAIGDEAAQFALLLIDLDHFRAINESFGTAAGDRVLADLAGRIRGCLRDGDIAGRVGGDQFALLVHRAGAGAAEATARRVLDAVALPCHIDSATFTVTCSIGVAVSPQHGRSLDELLRHAEGAMRAVKEAGRGSWRVSPRADAADRRTQMRLDHAMRQALVANRFRLHFQPKIDLASGAVVGAEALIRWRDPDFGEVPPGRFIPVAEDTGFIVAIGDWVMSQAVRQAAAWAEQIAPVPVAVNVSALQFHQPGFVDRVATVLAANGLPPSSLELELTESILVRDADDTLNRLNALARLGVRLAIDDFGTGYSSLSYLKRFPIGKLKIDRSFIKGLPGDESDGSIVRAICQMAGALSMRVIAEGVETEGQREFLRSTGCNEIQGFLYSPPLEPARFEELLRRYQDPPPAPAGAAAPKLVAA